jgi:hypothetical protein
MLTAHLRRPETISCGTITITHRTPFLALCRELVNNGYPDQPLEIVDELTGQHIATVPSIAFSATRTVDESGASRFAKYIQFPAGRVLQDAS